MQKINAQKKTARLPPYEMIGSIAMMDVPKGFRGEKKAALQILQEHKNIKTVAKKASATEGKYRIRKIKYVAGEKTSKTICRESGCCFFVDLNKTYYTPRFSHERLRVASQVRGGEKILVLFSGICPYPIVIEKNAKEKPGKIIAIELNPDAHKMALENIRMNKCPKIEAINADVKKELAKKKYAKWADRVIMPHPSEALKYLGLALKAARKGAIMHVYFFAGAKFGKKDILKAINAKKKAKLISYRMARPFSASISQYVADLKVF